VERRNIAPAVRAALIEAGIPTASPIRGSGRRPRLQFRISSSSGLALGQDRTFVPLLC